MTELGKYKMFLPTVRATALDDSCVEVTFADGSEAVLDIAELKGQGPWKKLDDPAFFRLAHAAYDTVVWTDEVDLAPEYVWSHAKRRVS